MEFINYKMMLRTLVLLVTVVYIKCDKSDEQTNAMLYLSNFGYLPSTASNLQSGAIVDENTWNNAISDFQAFAGIRTTGKLDKDTLETMKLPRCGVKDKGIVAKRTKRYILQGSRWKVKHLTYKISKYPKVSNFNDNDVNKEIQRAFEVWSEYTDLTFERKSRGQVHIEIQFVYGEHGDGDPFDGPGGTLAHAYFPVFGGDAHFDSDERWTINEFRGTNLFQVAAHEFGHSLGLSHSKVKDALMAPFYRGYQPDFKLHDDDIRGIQALYGDKSSTSSTTNKPKKTTPKPTSPPSGIDSVLCESPKLDTIFSTADGNTYMFKGDYYWKIGKETVESGYPKRISQGWSGLPANIDGAFTYSNGKTYFFKGKQYWRYIGRKMEPGYPKDISVGFTGIPDNIDSVMVWSGNGKIYFFKGSKFWRFDPSTRPPVKNTYPKPISNWEGVPDNLDAAFQYTNEYTYFFKGEAYYRFNDRAFAVESATPAFPRSVAYWWYGCKNANSLTLGNYREESQDINMAEKNDTSPYSNVEEFKFEPSSTIDIPRDSGASRNMALITLITVTVVAIFLNS